MADTCNRCGAVGGFGCYECTPETLQLYTQADLDAAVAAALREAASVAQNACLVPPDGGSPTEDEENVCRAAADYILALIPDAGAALDRVLAAERERCAKVALSFIGHDAKAEDAKDAGEGFDLACDLIAAAIRAQGKT